MLTLSIRSGSAPASDWGDGTKHGDGHGAGVGDDSPDGDGAIWCGGQDGDGYGESEDGNGSLARLLVEVGVEKLYLFAQVLNQGE